MSHATMEHLLAGIACQPKDVLTWLALADALEEQGELDRAELVRLSLRYWGRINDQPFDYVNMRLQRLLASGVKPCAPERVNSLGMRFSMIPEGKFQMGASEEETYGYEVEISRAFYMGVYEVTQGQYEKVMGNNSSWFSRTGAGKEYVVGLDTTDFPVESVSWEDADAFCQKLNEREKLSGWLYRLPTEAEWEYSCRGGAFRSQVFHCGNSLSSTQANFNGNRPYGGEEKGPYLARPCPVGSYSPNAFGLYDMHGNVAEWCQDWHAESYYARSPRRDPAGPIHGSFRVIRGGSWYSYGQHCQSALRFRCSLAFRCSYLGFRVAMVPRI